MSAGELPLYTPSNDAPSYAAEPQGDEQRLEIAGSSAEAQTALPVVSDSAIQAEPIPAKAEGVRIILERRKQEGKNVAVYRQSDVVKGEVVVDNPQGVKAVSIKLEGRQSVVVVLEDTLHDRGTLFSVERELWQYKNGVACPAKFEFSIPFPATFQDGKESRPLPPSFSGRWPGGPLIVGSVSYAVTVVVSKQQRFGWWDKDWTLSEPILYRPRSKPPLPTPESGPPFLSITKQIPEEWYHVTTSVPSQQEGVGAIDCHLFIPAGRTYAFDTTIPFQLQLRAPMNQLLAAQGAGSLGDPTHTVPPVLENTQIAEPGPSSSAKPSTSRTPLSMLSTLPQKLTGKQTEPGQKPPWVRVYLQRRITSKIYGQNAWSTMNIGEAELSSMSPPDGVDALVWEGRVVCHKKPHVIFSGFSTSRFEIKDFIVLHVKPEKPEISPWKEHKYSHPVHLVTDAYQG